MSALKNLNFVSAATTTATNDPFVNAKKRLLQNIDTQVEYAKQVIKGETPQRERKLYVEDDKGNKVPTMKKGDARLWFKQVNKNFVVSLRVSNRLLQLAKDCDAVQVSKIEEVPQVLQQLKQAVSNNELDDAITEAMKKSVSESK